MVWRATDDAIDVHVEEDDYRKEQIQLWMNKIIEVSYPWIR
jgi:hypothetical protein